jgi:hypothetical protein
MLYFLAEIFPKMSLSVTPFDYHVLSISEMRAVCLIILLPSVDSPIKIRQR